MNLLEGGEWGSWLAFDLMRRYPELLRSVTIQDPWPANDAGDLGSVPNLAGALGRYASLCSADAGCHRAFPNLVGQFSRDFVRFQQTPGTASLADSPRAPIPVHIDGESSDIALLGTLNTPEALPLLASQIYAPDPNLIATVINDVNGPLPRNTVPWGLIASLSCKDALPSNSVNAAQTEPAGVLANPSFAGVEENYQWDEAVCPIWHVNPDDATDFSPVASDIPTFLFGGTLSPVTNPAWFDQVAAQLDRSVIVRFPTLTLGVPNHFPSCLTQLRLSFLRQPDVPLKVASCEVQSPPIQFSGT